MAIVRCPQCKLPLTDEEARRENCSCGASLLGNAPEDDSKKSPPPAPKPGLRLDLRPLAAGIVFLALGVVGIWLVGRGMLTDGADSSQAKEESLPAPDEPAEPKTADNDSPAPVEAKKTDAVPLTTLKFEETRKPEDQAKKPGPAPFVVPFADPPAKKAKEEPKEPGVLPGHPGGVAAIVYSPDGRLLAVGSQDGTVKVWDAATSAERSTRKAHTGAILALAFSPNGQMLAAGGADKRLVLWELAAAAGLPLWQGQSSAIYAVQFAADGKSLLSGGWDRSVSRWDASTGEARPVLKRQQATGTDLIGAIAFSPDGGKVAWASKDGTVTIWDLQGDRERWRLIGHTGAVVALAFHSDGRLATGSRDLTVKLWDTATGRVQASCRGHRGAVNCTAFSPDGRTLATGSQDGTVKLWDTASGEERATLKEQAQVTAVAFSPDGKTLAVGNRSGTVNLRALPR
jgi:hypothetical protein